MFCRCGVVHSDHQRRTIWQRKILTHWQTTGDNLTYTIFIFLLATGWFYSEFDICSLLMIVDLISNK